MNLSKYQTQRSGLHHLWPTLNTLYNAFITPTKSEAINTNKLQPATVLFHPRHIDSIKNHNSRTTSSCSTTHLPFHNHHEGSQNEQQHPTSVLSRLRCRNPGDLPVPAPDNQRRALDSHQRRRSTGARVQVQDIRQDMGELLTLSSDPSSQSSNPCPS
jgi:hypothetical protein